MSEQNQRGAKEEVTDKMVVWEVVEVEGWSKRVVSLCHLVREYDSERLTVCGVPIPASAQIHTKNPRAKCIKCWKWAK